MPRKRQVDLIVGSDLIHQRILKHGKPVSESNGDIAPNLAVGQFENAVGRQGGMAFGQRLKALLQISEGLVGKDAVDFPPKTAAGWAEAGWCLGWSELRHSA